MKMSCGSEFERESLRNSFSYKQENRRIDIVSMSAFHQALDYLYSFVSYERKSNWHYSDKTLNLERFRAFLHLFGDPQFSLKAIHTAGSDGKGSVCAMIASVLRGMGFKVGVYLSPHLENIRERISVNGEWISERTFSRWTKILQEKMDALPPLRGGYATFFELITAMAFLEFQKRKVDYAVIETGLGGRLDSTNVMNPILTVITHISLEHTNLLGDTLEAVADEKLGIRRPGVPIVIGHQDSDVLDHIHRRLQDHEPPPICTDERYRALSQKWGRRYRTIEIQGGLNEEKKRIVQIPLFGHYQLQNTLTAVAALDVLQQTGALRPYRKEELTEGLRQVKWPGRFEIFRRPDRATVVLDVAHTAKGAASLRLSLDEIFPNKHRIFVAGFLEGKKIRSMVRRLARPSDGIVFTCAPSPRGMPIQGILDEIEGLHDVGPNCHQIENPIDAFTQAEAMAKPKDVIVVTGSLYLTGVIRKHFFSSEKQEGDS